MGQKQGQESGLAVGCRPRPTAARTWGPRLDVESGSPLGNRPQQSQVKASLWGAVNRKIHGGLEPQREERAGRVRELHGVFRPGRK